MHISSIEHWRTGEKSVQIGIDRKEFAEAAAKCDTSGVFFHMTEEYFIDIVAQMSVDVSLRERLLAAIDLKVQQHRMRYKPNWTEESGGG